MTKMHEARRLPQAANRLVTSAFRAGLETVDFSDLEERHELSHPLDLDAVRQLIDECLSRFTQDQPAEADAWLAPRLHYGLRLTRRQGSEREWWRWLGCVFADDYVRWRFGSSEQDPPSPLDVAAPLDRFVGPERKHALGRLWWMAELFRNGDDYLPVERAMRNQDIPNNLFRMDVAHHRPTVQAAVRVLEGKVGREANALARAINSAATTLLIDVIAPDDALDPDSSEGWVADDNIDVVNYFDELPKGPADPPANPAAVDRMTQLLGELLSEAPVRGRR
jgi:hypothetical protein